MPAQTKDMDLMKLMERFHSDEGYRAVLEELRWPTGVECPRCGSTSISNIEARPQYDCNSCRYQFSVTAGTIFHDSHLPLPKWFAATMLICVSKKGISANQMKRTLNVHYKTAWYLCHRIRAAMHEASPAPLGGTVEADETYVGGKTKGKGRHYMGNKTIVAGVMERDGNVRLKVVGDASRRTLHAFLKDHIRPDTERIMTDDWVSYRGIGDADTKHEVVVHSSREYVRGDVHTNTIENVWSLLKRSIVGSYHHLSEKHLDAYLDELEWRFNNRDNPWLFRDTLRRLLSSDNLPYAKLVD